MQKSSPSADVLPAKHVQKSAVGLHQAGGGLPATADPGTQGRLGRGIDGTRARGGQGDRKSTRRKASHTVRNRMPSPA